MDCLDENTVVAYVEGRLAGDAERALLEHSDTCESCRKLIAEMTHALVPAVSPLEPTEPSAAARTEPFRPGQTVGRYVVRDLIGAGGMGVVYEAYDPELERKVALKLLRTDGPVAHANELRQRLLREAQAMARIRHPNVITVYDVGTIGEQVFLAMELIEGSTLAEWRKAAPRPVPEIVRTYLAAGEGLRAAHAVGVVHRDFKPDNVLVGQDGRVCVTDFGLARPLAPLAAPSGPADDDARGADEGAARLAVTRAGAIVGTPAYMAPEQLRGEPADARADQFSFCVALFEALYDARPFAGRSIDELERAIADGRRVATERRLVPVRVRRALDRGLSADPERRFPSMSALLAQLVSRRRAQLGLTIALVAALALTGVLGWQRLQAGNRAQLCHDAAGKMTALWSPERRADVRRAIEGKAGAETWTFFAAGFDRYVQSWIAMHTSACAATWVHGEQSEALLDLRMDCLDQRYQDARALLDVVSTQPGAADHATAVLSHLPAIDACADVAALRRPQRPKAPARALEPLHALIARARTEKYADDCQHALADATQAATQAHALDAAALEGQALVLAGDAHECLGNTAAGRDAFLEGAATAARGQDDAVVAHAYIQLAAQDVADVAVESARHWLERAGEAITRLGGDKLLEAELSIARCSIEYNHENAAAAEPACRRGVALLAQLPGRPIYGEAVARMLLGQVLGDRGNFSEANEAYLAAQHIFATLLGPNSRDVLDVYTSMAEDERAQDHLETALALEKRVVDGSRAEWPAATAENLSFYALLLVEAGRPADALPILRDATAAMGKLTGEHPRQSGLIDGVLGAAYVELERPQQALGPLQRAWRDLPADDESLRGDLAIYLVRALWSATPRHAEAIEIATHARDYLRAHTSGAYRTRQVATIEAWLRAHAQ